MLIDGFTVAAQVVNFLILVWLMKRFLYKPILNAIDAREQIVAGKLAEADTQKSAADNERETLRQKNLEFDTQREDLLKSATDEAKTERSRLLEEARQASDDLRTQRQEALKREHEHLHDEIARRTGEEVFAIARKTLADLAGATLEERMSEMFAHRLRELDSTTRETLASSMSASSEAALVRSAFALSPEQQTTIGEALNETFATEVQVHFETAPDVISGIELTINGKKVAWSIAHYLTSLEESVGQLLKESPAARMNPKVQTPVTSADKEVT